MDIKPKEGILLIKKHTKTALKADIVTIDDENDRRLITGEVISDNSKKYKKGDVVVFGKYAIYLLTLKGDNFFFLDEEDVIAKCDYKEV
jgi:co-chaperonin GroES (HSP10)